MFPSGSDRSTSTTRNKTTRDERFGFLIIMRYIIYTGGGGGGGGTKYWAYNIKLLPEKKLWLS